LERVEISRTRIAAQPQPVGPLLDRLHEISRTRIAAQPQPPAG